VGQIFEVFVLGPKDGPVAQRCSVDDAVGEWERVARGVEGERRVQGNHLAALHHGSDLEGCVFTAFPENIFENFIDRDDGYEEFFRVFDRGREEGGGLAVGEIFQLPGGIDDVHDTLRRSGSLVSVVSIPRR
jgi:hypothetical protein